MAKYLLLRRTLYFLSSFCTCGSFESLKREATAQGPRIARLSSSSSSTFNTFLKYSACFTIFCELSDSFERPLSTSDVDIRYNTLLRRRDLPLVPVFFYSILLIPRRCGLPPPTTLSPIQGICELRWAWIIYRYNM